MKIFIFIEWALFHSQSLCYVINIYIYIYQLIFVGQLRIRETNSTSNRDEPRTRELRVQSRRDRIREKKASSPYRPRVYCFHSSQISNIISRLGTDTVDCNIFRGQNSSVGSIRRFVINLSARHSRPSTVCVLNEIGESSNKIVENENESVRHDQTHAHFMLKTSADEMGVENAAGLEGDGQFEPVTSSEGSILHRPRIYVPKEDVMSDLSSLSRLSAKTSMQGSKRSKENLKIIYPVSYKMSERIETAPFNYNVSNRCGQGSSVDLLAISPYGQQTNGHQERVRARSFLVGSQQKSPFLW